MKKILSNKHIIACAAIVGSVFFYGSCTEELDIRTDPGPQRLVIYGTVADNDTGAEVWLQYTTGYFSTQQPERISGAEVVIFDGERELVLYEGEDGDTGIYRNPYGFSGEPGKTYTLTVKVDSDKDGNYEVYRASSRMPQPVHIGGVSLRPRSMLGISRTEVLFTGTLPENDGYYLNFRVSRNMEAGDTLSKFRIMEQRYLGKTSLENVPVYYLSDDDESEKLVKGDVLYLRVDVLENGYGKFLSSAKSELSGSIPIFSGPPANIETNIELVEGSTETAPLGFFGAYSTRSSSTKYE